jgi:hypothetical protein
MACVHVVTLFKDNNEDDIRGISPPALHAHVDISSVLLLYTHCIALLNRFLQDTEGR